MAIYWGQSSDSSPPFVRGQFGNGERALPAHLGGRKALSLLLVWLSTLSGQPRSSIEVLPSFASVSFCVAFQLGGNRTWLGPRRPVRSIVSTL